MFVTLDQARALDALARHRTFQAAAQSLHKVHTAVLYAINGLETQSGLQLIDRSGYRNKLTPAGEKVLEHCRRLLDAERDLVSACAEIKSGWEPELRVVFDGVLSASPILQTAGALAREHAPTRLEVSVDYLEAVEQRFEREEAQVMLSVLPSRLPDLQAIPLPKLKARLVAHRSHPLARAKKPLSPEALSEHVFLTVRGSHLRLQLSTGDLEQRSTIRLSDFHAKKAAIVSGIGFGWLPEWLIGPELRKKALVPLRLRRANLHVFEPRLYHRAGTPGRALSRLIFALTAAP